MINAGSHSLAMQHIDRRYIRFISDDKTDDEGKYSLILDTVHC